MALDYLRSVDNELKKVDALLHDLNKPRFEGRAVAGVDSPERFSEHIPVRGWRPVDARIAITDAAHLVEDLGGEQLYGKRPEVGLRELLQNAQDAVNARAAIDSDFGDREIRVLLVRDDDTWVLSVIDQGVGMDEDILTNALLDFGRSGWTSDVARSKFAGLADGGFRPKGRFGIGFFSVFILGDDVEITTRRFDAAPSEARRILFQGVRKRPILTPLSTEERAPIGNTVRIVLKNDPYESKGLFWRTYDEELGELVQTLCVQRSVSFRADEPHRGLSDAFDPTDLVTANTAEVFDLLYPPLKSDGQIQESQRQLQRAEFVRHATEVLGPDGTRIGLASLGDRLSWGGPRLTEGAVIVDGFRADDHISFTGYLVGQPSRASRDNAELVADHKSLCAWLRTQEDRMRALGQFGPSVQARLAYTLLRANRALPDDYYVAFLSSGLSTVEDVTRWAKRQQTIRLCQGWPLGVLFQPLMLIRYPEFVQADLPDGWIFPVGSYLQDPFDRTLDDNRDEQYEFARSDSRETWQKRWWRMSGTVEGYVLRVICVAWECEIGDILAPVAERNWSDFADHSDDMGPVPVYRLTRPTPLAG